MRNRKLLIIIILLALLGIVFVVLEKTGVTNFIKLPSAPETSSGPTPEQKQQEAATNAESKKQVVENDKGSTNTATDTPTDKSIELTAERGKNETVTVFTKLNNYSDGTCNLVVTNAEKTTTQSAPVIYQRESSTCAGFSVPIEPLGKGMWNLKLAVTSNGATDSKTTTFEVK